MSGPLAFLCAQLGVTEPQLQLLPPDFLIEKIKKSQATDAQQAAALVAIAGATPKAKSIADYYAEKDERTTFPWKIAENRAAIQLEHLSAQFSEATPFEPLKKIFLAQAKAGQLSAMESVVLQYLLFPKNADMARFTLAHLLLTIPPASRLAVHNWGVAASMSKARREAYGQAIEACAFPLFPDEEELSTLNSRLLVAALPSLNGGSAPPADGGVFAKRPAETLWGGGALPILTTAAGTFLETGPLEAALGAIAGQVAAVQGQLRTHKARAQQQHHHQPQQQRGRGRGVHRGRGRGRGGYYGGGGAEEADDQDPATVMPGNGPAPPTH